MSKEKELKKERSNSIEEVFHNIYKVEVPLPNSPLKYINAYIIKGGHNLVIDTGMDRAECRQALLYAFDYLDIDLHHTDFLITHIHADHSGLVKYFATKDSRIYISKEELASLMSTGGSFWEQEALYARKQGFPAAIIDEAIKRHPGYRYSGKEKLEAEISLLDDGDKITLDEYVLKCIKTPGHTRGLLCLYEEDKKILFSSDHILQGITPNISASYGNDNPLASYMKSLDKIYNLEVDYVFPGHRKIFSDLKQRIDELKLHHVKRLNEILLILDKKPQDAYSVASQMSWDIHFKRWDDFPIPQKWFAHSEAIAHLQYLQDKGLAQSTVVEGVSLFSRLHKDPDIIL